MLYYFEGEFHPFNKRHFAILDALCRIIQEGRAPVQHDKEKDKILICLLPLKDESGIEGCHLCSNEEYRAEMIEPSLDALRAKYPEIGEDEFDIDIKDGKIDSNEFCKAYCDKHGINGFMTLSTMRLDVSFDNLEADSEKARNVFHRDPYATYDSVREFLNRETFDAIKKWNHYWQLGEEDEYWREQNNYLRDYDVTKYPKASATATMILVKDSKVLLVRRGNFPYKGFWSLPGGFFDVNEDDSLEDTASRELEEETGILEDFTQEEQFRVYSDSGTDPRDRIINTVYAIKTNGYRRFKPGDDASEICWFDVKDLPRMAFNHRKIVVDYLNSLKEEKEDE